jgi:hypothetical protein
MGVTFSIRFDPLKVSFKLPYSPGKFNPSRKKRYPLFVIGQRPKRATSMKNNAGATATDNQEPLQSAIRKGKIPLTLFFISNKLDLDLPCLLSTANGRKSYAGQEENEKGPHYGHQG